MKFGLLDFDLTVKAYWENAWNHKALLNIGDAAEYLIIEQLYRSLGIDDHQFKRISIPELISYRGESLVVALNIALDSYVGYNDILDNMSPDIIPIFLGMSFARLDFSQKQLECLKKFAPVGCRDERSFLSMRTQGIPCYLNGCVASALEVKGTCPGVEDKVLLIDVPYGVLEYIPQELKKEIVFVNQEIYCKKSEMPEDFMPSVWAQEILSCYNSNPKMIVSSRFHAAVLALANNVPAIIALEKYTFRFSWLQNYCPIYTDGNYEEINWAPKPINYNTVRKKILYVAQRRIRETIKKYQDILQLTDMQRVFNAENEADSSNWVLYYRKAWEQIQREWDTNQEYFYGFWGVNDNTKKLYTLITQNYPKAKLVDVYDLFQEVCFQGITSKHPQKLKYHALQKNYYVIVTAYLASRVVPDICEISGFSEERVICCTRDFITPENLRAVQ